MRFISHLDFIRLIYRALRRAEIPFVLTSGFSPRPKVKFGQALKLGVEGEMLVQFFLTSKIALQEFKDKMEKQLNEGLRIVGIDYAE